MRTVSRCRPNSRAASRMLMPSTITARRTRRYDSTWYILGTFHGVENDPMDGGRRYGIQPPIVSDLSAHVVQFNSSNYRDEDEHDSAVDDEGEAEYDSDLDHGGSISIEIGAVTKLKPRWDVHSGGDKDWLGSAIEAIYPCLENDSAVPFALHHLRISPWLWFSFSGYSVSRTPLIR